MSRAYKQNYRNIDWSVPIVTERPPRPRGPRSRAVACPMLILDTLPELVGQHDGKVYTSKAALRRAYKEAGLVEVGNDAPTTEAPKAKPKISRDDVAQAVAKVRAGYKPSEEKAIGPVSSNSGFSDVTPGLD